MSVGDKIKKIRHDNQLSQEQFAAIFHVTRQTVSNWENNRNYPDMSSLKQISDNIRPDAISEITAEFYDMNSNDNAAVNRELDYETDQNDIKVRLLHEWFHNEYNEIFYECVLTVQYVYAGKSYTSITAINISDKQYDMVEMNLQGGIL